MSDCTHLMQTKVVDRLGLMTEKPDGTISAPVLEWSIVCADDECGEVLFVSAEAYGSVEKVIRPAKMATEPPPSTDHGWITHRQIKRSSLFEEFTQALRALLGRR